MTSRMRVFKTNACYAPALKATTAEAYIAAVSRVWATDPDVLLECYFEKFRSTGFRLGAPSSSKIAAFTNSVFFVG
jgi:hypothetical protein